jgi:hypothetical protein
MMGVEKMPHTGEILSVSVIQMWGSHESHPMIGKRRTIG